MVYFFNALLVNVSVSPSIVTDTLSSLGTLWMPYLCQRSLSRVNAIVSMLGLSTESQSCNKKAQPEHYPRNHQVRPERRKPTRDHFLPLPSLALLLRSIICAGWSTWACCLPCRVGQWPVPGRLADGARRTQPLPARLVQLDAVGRHGERPHRRALGRRRRAGRGAAGARAARLQRGPRNPANPRPARRFG